MNFKVFVLRLRLVLMCMCYNGLIDYRCMNSLIMAIRESTIR